MATSKKRTPEEELFFAREERRKEEEARATARRYGPGPFTCVITDGDVSIELHLADGTNKESTLQGVTFVLIRAFRKLDHVPIWERGRTVRQTLSEHGAFVEILGKLKNYHTDLSAIINLEDLAALDMRFAYFEIRNNRGQVVYRSGNRRLTLAAG